MDLLSLLHVGVVLRDSFQSELVHQVDGVGGPQMSVLHVKCVCVCACVRVLVCDKQ